MTLLLLREVAAELRMSDPAKPCPFCGGTKVSVHEGSTFRWQYAACDECGARCGEVRKAYADPMDEWNERASET